MSTSSEDQAQFQRMLSHGSQFGITLTRIMWDDLKEEAKRFQKNIYGAYLLKL